MAGIFSVDDIPAWMNPTRAVLETGQMATAGIGRNFAASFSQAQEEKARKDLLQQKQTLLQKENERLAGKAMPIATALQGATTPEQSWQIVSQNPQWLADPETAPFVGQYLKTQADVAKAEVGTIAGKVAIADSTEFAKRSAAVDAETRAGLKAMRPNPDGTPSPMMWQALGLAEERTKLQAENQRKRVEIEALQRGDLPTTTISEKGVTQTFRPSTTAAPREMTLSTGAKIAYNPKTGAFQFMDKSGKKDEYTKAQLLAIASHRQKTDAEDADAKKIIDFVTSEALQQIGGGTNKVLKYNPATGKIE